MDVTLSLLGFPHSSVGKKSACNAEDPGLIPGSGRSAGGVIGYPLQYSWASLVAQLVKNTAAMRETWVWFLGWEDPVEKGKATHSSISGLENSMDYVVHGVSKTQTWLSDFHFHCLSLLECKFHGVVFPVVFPALEAKPSRKGTLDRQLLWLKIIGLWKMVVRNGVLP